MQPARHPDAAAPRPTRSTGYSRSLWLGSRRRVLSHAGGGGVTLVLAAACAALPAGPWRSAGLALAACALLYFGFVLLALGGLVLRLDNETRRKSVHLLAGAVLVGLFVASGSTAALALACATLAAWALLAPRSAKLRGLHQSTLQRGGGDRSAGELLFPVGLLATAVAAGGPDAAWLAGALTLICSDTAAALVGRRWGRLRLRLPGGSKTAQGCAAFAFCTLAIAWLLAPAAPLAALLAWTALLTAVEAASPWGLDNLTLPLVAWSTWPWLLAAAPVA